MMESRISDETQLNLDRNKDKFNKRIGNSEGSQMRGRRNLQSIIIICHCENFLGEETHEWQSFGWFKTKRVIKTK